MKKVIAFVLLGIISVCFCLSSAAVQNDKQFEYVYDNGVEIVFDGNTPFTVEQRQVIANYLAEYDDSDTSDDSSEPVRLSWCWLVGHDYKTDYVMRITHKVREHSPRCFSETYEVTTCTKCEYIDAILRASGLIPCCPED